MIDSELGDIPEGWGISALCWNSANNKVYCANSNTSTITIIDGVTNSVITTIWLSPNFYPSSLVYNSIDVIIWIQRGMRS